MPPALCLDGDGIRNTPKIDGGWFLSRTPEYDAWQHDSAGQIWHMAQRFNMPLVTDAPVILFDHAFALLSVYSA
jgi:hypothetical protein